MKFLEDQLTFKTFDSLVLKGMLTLPKNGPILAPVLLMVGTGCADMDETVPAKLTTNNKEARLFQQIASELSAFGFAVFRYNKRGVISTKKGPRFNYKIWNRLSRNDLIEDGVCAAQKLLELTNFKKTDLIILGHSEGTIIGTEVAINLGGKIKSLILLGVVSRSMKELAYHQNVLNLIGKDYSKIYLEECFEKDLKEIFKLKDGLLPGTKQPIKWLQESLDSIPNRFRLKNVKCKVAIFHGESDTQTPFEDACEIKKMYGEKILLTGYKKLGHGFSRNMKNKPTLGPIEKKVLKDISAYCLKVIS